MKLILASGSSGRRELLDSLGLEYEVVVSGVEEVGYEGEKPEEMVARLATEKVRMVVTRLREGVSLSPSVGLELDISPSGRGRNSDDHERGLVIGADTTVVCEGEMIGKPKDREDARQIIELLQGKTHEVITGVCVMEMDTEDMRVEVDEARITLLPMSDKQIDGYLKMGEWEGKAGGYQLQRTMGKYVANIEGSRSGIIGLPLLVLEEMLESFGYMVEVDVRQLEEGLLV